MEAFRLNILPVYSEYHPTAQIGGVRLLRHQVETIEAYKDAETDVIINTAMTGDGKSLAAYLPVFQEQQAVVAMYPTNELVRDQCFALPYYQRTMSVRLARYDTMYSERITQLMREHDNTIRLEEVRNLLEHNSMLLTNPDLIHLIMSHQYGWDYLLKELPVTASAYFDYFLFDEFHVFEVPQVISVTNMLGYLQAYYRDKPNDRKKFVFLSATPSKLLDGLLARSGLRCARIEGHYRSSEQGEAYRRILQRCEIELHEVSQDAPTEQWIEQHLPEMANFFRQHPGAKAAILVNSPATARRLVARLKEFFGPQGITIGENTGLIPQQERREALEKQILVGTSTVDIGIDFHINYLIFEAFSAGSFLQRFGRLGRHDEFSTYRAYALMPRFVLERMALTLGNEEVVERERFNEAIRDAFPTEQEFASYTGKWGKVQAAHVLAQLRLQSNKDANRAFAEALREQYDRIYGTPEKLVMTAGLKKYWGLKNNKSRAPILNELLSFRGQSPLECGVWDTTASETHPDGHLLTYDLFFLLANTEYETLPKERFMQEVRKRGLEERDFQDKLLYFKIHNYVPERLGLILGLRYDLNEYTQTLHHVQVLTDFFIREPASTWLDQVNRALKRLPLTCILSDKQRTELKQQLKLGATFPVYRLQDSAGHEYTVAFGQQALLLDAVLSYRKAGTTREIMA